LEDKILKSIVLTLMAVINFAVYSSALVLIIAYLGLGWNAIFIPERCWPIETTACSAVVTFVLWGGAFLEGTGLALVTYFINKAVMQSFFLPAKPARIIFYLEVTAALLLCIAMGIGE
jgi:hypothetical protein